MSGCVNGEACEDGWIACCSPGGPCPPRQTVCETCGPCRDCLGDRGRVYVLAPTFRDVQRFQHEAGLAPRQVVYVDRGHLLRGVRQPLVVDLGLHPDASRVQCRERDEIVHVCSIMDARVVTSLGA